MKCSQIFLFFAVCGIFAIVAADLTYSINDSEVPNLEYEVDAIECLQEAYVLYPDNTSNKRNEAVSKLFQNRHKETKGWNIAEGCTSSYNPGSTIFVEVLVHNSDDGSETVVKIFN